MFSLKKFREFARKHYDGWGLGWYKKSGHHGGYIACVFKEPIGALESKKYLELAKRVRSHIFVAHVRKASVGGRKYENTHPFRSGKWIFAHNGTIDRECLLGYLKNNYKRRLRGETDSEAFFYLILQCIEEMGNVEEGIRIAISRAYKCDTSKQNFGLNFILSDGTKLYAFRYGRPEKKYRLYILRRPLEGVSIEKYSSETQVLIRMKLERGEKAILISSEPLTEDEEWIPIGLGKLVIIDEDLRVRELEPISDY